MNKIINNNNQNIAKYRDMLATHPTGNKTMRISPVDMYKDAVADEASKNILANEYNDDTSFGQRFKHNVSDFEDVIDKIPGVKTAGRFLAPAIAEATGPVSSILAGGATAATALASLVLPDHSLRDNFHSFMAEKSGSEKMAGWYQYADAKEQLDKAKSQYDAVVNLYSDEYKKEQAEGKPGEATAAINSAKRDYDIKSRDLGQQAQEGIAYGNDRLQAQKYWESDISDRFNARKNGDLNLTDPDTYIYRLSGLMGSSAAGVGWQIANMAGTAVASASIGALTGSAVPGAGTAIGATIGAGVGMASAIAGLIGSRHNESAMEAFGGYRDKIDKLLDSTKGISKDYVADVVKAQLRKSNPNNLNINTLTQEELIDLAATGQVSVPNKHFGDILKQARTGVSYVYDSNNTLAVSDLAELGVMVMPFGNILSKVKPLSKAIEKGTALASKLKLDKATEFISHKGYIPEYISNRVDDVANWAISKTTKDIGKQVARKGVFDRAASLLGKTGFVVVSEGNEEGTQDMIRDSFQANTSDEHQNMFSMWLDNTGRAARSTFAAFTPWDPVYSSDKNFINDFKGGALLGGFMSLLGVGARNARSISHPLEQYRMDKMVGTLLADQTVAKDNVNKGSTYANLGKNGKATWLYNSFDDIKSSKPNWVSDQDLEAERTKAIRIAKDAYSVSTQDQAKSINIDPTSNRYDRFVSLKDYYNTESEKSQKLVKQTLADFDAAVSKSQDVKKLVHEIVEKSNANAEKNGTEPITEERVLSDVKEAFIYNILKKQSDIAETISKAKKEYSEKYGIELSPKDTEEYSNVVKSITDKYDELERKGFETNSKGKKNSKAAISSIIERNRKILSPITDALAKDEDISKASKEHATALVQSRFANNNSNIFNPEISVSKTELKGKDGKPVLDDKGNKVTVATFDTKYTKEQGDEINKRVDKSLKVTDEDNKIYNETSEPDDLKQATAAETAERKANEQADKESTEAIKQPVNPQPVEPATTSDLKPSNEPNVPASTTNQPNVVKPVEGLKTGSTAKSEQQNNQVESKPEVKSEKAETNEQTYEKPTTETINQYKSKLDEKAKEVNFDEATHKYTYTSPSKKDKEIVSVTQSKDQTIYKFRGTIEEAYRNRLAQFGTFIHGILENMFKGIQSKDMLYDGKLNAIVDKYKKNYYVLSAEQLLVDDKHNLAGTADLILVNKETGKLLIVDYKTEENRHDNSIPFGSKLYGYKDIPAVVEGYFYQLHLYRKMLANTLGINESDIDMEVLPIQYSTKKDEVAEYVSNIDETLNPLTDPNSDRIEEVIDEYLNSRSQSVEELHPTEEAKNQPVDANEQADQDEVTEKVKPTDKEKEAKKNLPEVKKGQVVEQDIFDQTIPQEVSGDILEEPVKQVVQDDENYAIATADLSNDGKDNLTHLLNHDGRRGVDVAKLTGFEDCKSPLELDKALCTKGFIENCDAHFEVRDYKGKPAIYCILEYNGNNKKLAGKYVTTVYTEESLTNNLNRINHSKLQHGEEPISVVDAVAELKAFRDKILAINAQGKIAVPTELIVTNGKFNYVITKDGSRVTNKLIDDKKVVVGCGIPEDIFDISVDNMPNIGVSMYNYELDSYVITYPGLTNSNTVYADAGGIFMHISGEGKQWLPGGSDTPLNIKLQAKKFSNNEAILLLNLIVKGKSSAKALSQLKELGITPEEFIDFMLGCGNLDAVYAGNENVVNKTIRSYGQAVLLGKDAGLQEELKSKMICVHNGMLYIGNCPAMQIYNNDKVIQIGDDSAGIPLSSLNGKDNAEVISMITNNLHWSLDKSIFLPKSDNIKSSATIDKIFNAVNNWYRSNGKTNKLSVDNAVSFQPNHFNSTEEKHFGKSISPLAWYMFNGYVQTDLATVSAADKANGISTSLVREPFVYAKDVTAKEPKVDEPKVTKEVAKELPKESVDLISSMKKASARKRKVSGPHSEQIGEAKERIDTEKAKNWLGNKLGLSNEGDVEIVKDASLGVTKSGLYVMGACREDSIMLSSLAERGTEFHEAWHRVSNLLISDKSRNNIYNRFRRKFNVPAATDASIDEVMAENFKTFMLSFGNDVEYDTKNWFRRISNFVRTWAKVDDYKLAKLYYQINTGKFANAKTQHIARFRALYGDAGAPFVVNGYKFMNIPNTKTFNTIISNLSNLVLSQSTTLDDVENLNFGIIKDTLNAILSSDDIDQEYKDLYNEVINHFNDIFLPKIKQQLKKYSIRVQEEADEDFQATTADSNADPEISKISDHIDLSYEKSKLKSISTQLRLVFSSIAENEYYRDDDGKYVISRKIDPITGMPTVLDYNETVNKMLQEFSDVTNSDELIARLKERSNKSMFYRDVYARLLNATKSDKYIFDKAVVFLHCHTHDFVTVQYSEGEDGVFNYNIVNNTLERRSLMYPTVWSSMFVGNGNYVTFDKDGNITLTKDSTGKTMLESTNNEIIGYQNKLLKKSADFDEINNRKIALLNIFRKLGIAIDMDTLDSYMDSFNTTHKSDYACVNDLTYRMFLELRPRLELLSHKSYNLNSVTVNKEQLKLNKIFTKLSLIADISRVYTQNELAKSENMALGVDNKRLYTKSQNSFATERADELNNRNDDVLTNLSQTPYSGKMYNQVGLDNVTPFSESNAEEYASYIVDTLMKDPDANLHIETFINFKDETPNSEDNDYFQMNDCADYITKLVATSNDRIVFPTIADKKTYFMMSGIKLFHNTYTNGKFSLDALNLFRKYCYADLQSIEKCSKELQEQKEDKRLSRSKIKNYHTATAKVKTINANGTTSMSKAKEPNGLRFRFLTEIIDRAGNKVDLNDLNLNYEQRVKLAIDNFFSKTKEEQLDILDSMLNTKLTTELNKCKELGIIDYDSMDGYINKLLPREFNSNVFGAIADNLVNTIVSVNEVERAFTGDPAFYAQSFTVVYDKSGNKITYADRSTDKIKRLGGLSSTGTDCLNIKGEEDYTCCEIHVPEMKSNKLDLISSWFHKTSKIEAIQKNSKLFGDETADIIDAINNNNEEALNKYYDEFKELKPILLEANDAADNLTKSYGEGKIDTVDGGCFISPNMYKNLLKREGRYTADTELAFKLLTTEGTIKLDDNEQKLFTDYLKSKGFKDKEIDSYFNLSNGSKIFFNNPAEEVLSNPSLYSYVSQIIMNPLKYVAYGTRFVNGLAVPNFDKFALFPLFKGITKGTQIDKLYDRMVTSDEANGINPIDMVMMDSAVKVGSNNVTDFYKDFNEEDNSGTVNDLNKLGAYSQKYKYLRHQLETDPHEKSEIVAGTQMIKQCMSNISDDFMYGKDDDKISGLQIKHNIFSALNKLSDFGLDKLKKKFGYDDNDATKIMKYVLQEAVGSDANKNVIDALSDDDASLSALSDLSFIESKIIASVYKNSVDTVLDGGSYIQRPPLATDEYNVVKEGEERSKLLHDYVMNNGKILDDVNGDGSLNCVMSITAFKDVIPGFSKKTFTEARQYLIDNHLIGDSAEAMFISARIPTQAIASVSALCCRDVLPANMGDTIILPRFFTKLTGSDFDVDKLFIVRKSISKYKENGITKSKVDDYDANNVENNTTEDSVRNFLLHNYMRILATDSKQGEMKNSIDNSTSLLKDTLAEIEQDLKPEGNSFVEEYTPTFQLKKKHDYTSGKKGIGPMALQSVHHVLTQCVDFYMLNPGFTFDGNGYNNELHLNRIFDNKISSDYKQSRILDWFSGLINAFVDIAKDPYITRLNVNAYTYDAISFMLRVGLGKSAFYFLNNPMIKDLATYWNNGAGSFGQDSDMSWFDKDREIKTMLFNKYGGTLSKYNEAKQRFDTMGIISALFNNNDSKSLQNLKEFLMTTSSDLTVGNDSLSKPVAIMLAWDEIRKAAKELSSVIKVSNVDTKRMGNVFAELEEYNINLSNVQKSVEDPNSYLFGSNVNELFDDTFISHKLANSVGFIYDFFSDKTINMTDAFNREIMDLLAKTAGSNNYNLANKLKILSNSMMTSIKSDFFNNNFVYSNGKKGISGIRDMFFGENDIRANTMARRLAVIKSKIYNGEIPGLLSEDGQITNDLLNNLSPVIETLDPQTPDFISLSRSTDSEVSSDDNLISSFEDLLDFDGSKDVRDFAKDLVAYAFYTSGDNASFGNIFRYVPNSERKRIGYNAYLKNKLNDIVSSDNVSIDDYDIIKNNYSNPLIVDRYKLYKTVRDKTTHQKYKVQNTKAAYMVTDNYGYKYPLMFCPEKDTFNRPYVTCRIASSVVGKPATTILYVNVGNITNNYVLKGREYNIVTPLYIAVSKKGYKRGGLQLLEYGFNSLFDSNKVFHSDEFSNNIIEDKVYNNPDLLLNALEKLMPSIRMNESSELSLNPAKTINELIFDDIEQTQTDSCNYASGKNAKFSSLYPRPVKSGNYLFKNAMQYMLWLKAKEYVSHGFDAKQFVTKLENQDITNDELSDLVEKLGDKSRDITLTPKDFTSLKNYIKTSILTNEQTNDISQLLLGNTENMRFTDEKTYTTLYRQALLESLSELRNSMQKGTLYEDMVDNNKSNDRVIEKEVDVDIDNKLGSTYINHSGGANGADSYWQNIGEKYGVKTNAYYSGEKTPQGNIEISKEDYDEGRYEAAKAAKRNYGYKYSTMKNDLLIRDWSQVKHADSIFAISNIVGEGEKIFPDQKNDPRYAIAPSVTGGTGYAVGMAINHNKPIYVYNQGKINNSYEKGWYKYDYSTNDFVKTDIPILTNNFAGIGSRNLSQDDIKQIENVYSRTFSNNISSREQQKQEGNEIKQHCKK